MNIKNISIISFICLTSGCIFFLFHKEFIIINTGANQTTHTTTQQTHHYHAHKKEISCYFWHKNSWQEEKKHCLWSDNKELNLRQVITMWLTTLEQEGALTTKINVQLVALNNTGYMAFLSLDSNPLPQNGAFHYKLLWVEGLLKTIKNSGVVIQSIYFLHNHKPLIDPHLDFSQPWPINGFLTQ